MKIQIKTFDEISGTKVEHETVTKEMVLAISDSDECSLFDGEQQTADTTEINIRFENYNELCFLHSLLGEMIGRSKA